MRRLLQAVIPLTALAVAACGYPDPYASAAPIANESPAPLATVSPSRGAGSWQPWKVGWRAQPGRYALRARATDSTGEVQPAEPRWNPGGYLYNAWDAVRCEVRS